MRATLRRCRSPGYFTGTNIDGQEIVRPQTLRRLQQPYCVRKSPAPTCRDPLESQWEQADRKQPRDNARASLRLTKVVEEKGAPREAPDVLTYHHRSCLLEMMSFLVGPDSVQAVVGRDVEVGAIATSEMYVGWNGRRDIGFFNGFTVFHPISIDTGPFCVPYGDP